LSELNLASWRRRIGYVGQEVMVFDDTVRGNLCLIHPESDEGQIVSALAGAHLTDVVRALPDGLDTEIGENGVRLSGGEKQRLTLARALVGDPDLLLLDEATSALDNESERLVQEAIEAAAGKYTMLVVAHRLSTVRRADMIYVMEKGRVVEQGKYAELLAMNGRFSQLHGLLSA
jgi:subfamily B ATP-binding cassette protein MsbA